MELPLDILKEIALKTPGAYRILSQTTKLISFDKHWLMQHFTTLRLGVKDSEYEHATGYRLPNGDLHIINDTVPSIIIGKNQYWFYQGKRHRDSRSVSGTDLAGNDLPAVIDYDGYQVWYRHGVEYTSEGKVR